jgi:2-desacetyl-2-hydroxyethyl bacteriochlorophyllide A dehydrogenase
VKAALLYGPRDLRVGSLAAPTAGPDDVVIRITHAGLCGTDYRIWTGDRSVAYPRIMGHELVGQVEAVGTRVQRVTAGQPVVVEPNFSCGQCPLCREGNRNLCLARTAVGIDVDGGFAEAVRVPGRCCWPAPAGVSPEDLVLTEPLAVVVRAVNRAVPRRGETAAVIGAGTLGLLALQVLRARGVRVLVVTRTAPRRELAREFGAEAAHALTDGPSDAAAQRFAEREGVDMVVETAGTPDAVTEALAVVRPGGRVVLTGLPHVATPVVFASVVKREVTVTGSMIYQEEFPEALRLVADGAVRTRALVTHRFELEAIGEAFTAHRDPASIKVAVRIS